MKSTFVTGLWDINRGSLREGWARPYSFYLERLTELLQTDANFIIFGDEALREYVFSFRSQANTQFIVRDLDWFRAQDYYEKVQVIRNDPEWKNQAEWLVHSTQSELELYNPVVMAKFFLLNECVSLDKFGADALFWIDAGITHTVHEGYFTKYRVLDKLAEFEIIEGGSFLMLCYQYEGNTEIHGFEREALAAYCRVPFVKYVARGTFFGGLKTRIGVLCKQYGQLLHSTLDNGLMGTEESVFTIMAHQCVIHREFVDPNGLTWPFFEKLKGL